MGKQNFPKSFSGQAIDTMLLSSRRSIPYTFATKTGSMETKENIDMARIGKIARLPGGIRSQLNSRLQDNVEGKQIVQWLNSLPEVQKVLAKNFDGRPINEQNLTDWRQGGYEEWLAR